MLRRRVERLLHAPVVSLRRVWAGSVGSVVVVAAVAMVIVQTPALVAFAALPIALIEQTPSMVATATHEIAAAATAAVVHVSAAEQSPAPEAPEAPEVLAPPAALSSLFASVMPAPPANETVDSQTTITAAAPATHDVSRDVGETTDASAPSAVPAAPLPSTPIAVSTPATQEIRSWNSSLATPFVNLGSAVADASVSTGMTAARAGKAIGGWFKF
jgi:hypothetical protein